MNRKHQIILIVSTLGLTWLGMMIVHEFGHVLGAWTSGGAVARVNLPPFGFSSTEYKHIPHPLWTVWAGPLFGVALPVIAWLVAMLCKARFTYLLRFFAGFCLLANGAYLGVGSFGHIADAGNLLDLGAAAWQLWLFGGICMPLSFLFWHRLGTHFGLGKAKGSVNPSHTYATLLLLVCVFFIETLFLFI